MNAITLLFEYGERCLHDDRLCLQVEAVSELDQSECEIVQTLIDGVPLMHDAERRLAPTWT